MHYLLLGEDDRQLVEQYADSLLETVVKLVTEARAKIAPAELEWGSGTATFATNRRNNSEKEVPQLRQQGELKGPIDHDVPVLCVAQQGQLSAILFGYACHCTTLSSFEWSGDYAGFAQLELESRHPGCVAMFWAGCGGDQNPLPRRTVDLAISYGLQLADSVDAVLQGKCHQIDDQLKTAYREIDLRLAELPTPEQLTNDTKSNNKYVASRARYLLQKLEGHRQLSATYPYPIQVWKLGSEIDFVLLGGEVVVDYAVKIKERFGAKDHRHRNVWCAGYANDVMAYIPSLRVLLEGGYEGGGAMIYYGLPTVWAPDIEEDILNTVGQMITATD